jgi:hypothetical protein
LQGEIRVVILGKDTKAASYLVKLANWKDPPACGYKWSGSLWELVLLAIACKALACAYHFRENPLMEHLPVSPNIAQSVSYVTTENQQLLSEIHKTDLAALIMEKEEGRKLSRPGD